MDTSTKNQFPVSKKSGNLLAKVVTRVDKCQQTCQPENFSNLDLVSELNLVVTNDTSCHTNFQSEINRSRYVEANTKLRKKLANNHRNSFTLNLELFL